MKRALTIIAAVAALALSVDPAPADGFSWFFAHVKPSGKCHGQREIAASFYSSGARTANGEPFRVHGLTAASRTLPFGAIMFLQNPKNGMSVYVRINDRGPFGVAHDLGVEIDLSRGAAAALGMTQTAWVCASRV